MGRMSMSRALAMMEEMQRRLEGPKRLTIEDTGTMEGRDPAEVERERETAQRYIDEIRAAMDAGDWATAQRLSKKFVQHYQSPARPPRSQRPRCGAMTRKGTPCKMAAYWAPGEPAPRNGRCRIHGGLSTGPVTPEGKAAIAESNRRRAMKHHGMEQQ